MRMIFLCLILAIANVASAKAPYEVKDIVLLQPEAVLQERVTAEALVPYIELVNAAALEVLSGQKYEPAGGFLVLAIRPGKQSAAWLDIRPALPPDLARALVARLHALPVPSVEVGPVVFAVRASLLGGELPVNNVPEPDEWKQAARQAGKEIETGDLVERIWPR